MAARRKLDGTVSVLLLAAAVAATAATVPGVWRSVAAFAALVLTGIGLILAVRRAHRHQRSSA